MRKKREVFTICSLLSNKSFYPIKTVIKFENKFNYFIVIAMGKRGSSC